MLIGMMFQAAAWGAAASGPRVTSLALQPSRFDTGQRYALLPKAGELVEGDAVPLYDKAVESLPKNIDNNQIREWTSDPLSELPLDQVQAFLQQAQPALESIAKASKCKSCNWPPFQAGTTPAHLSEYRQLTFILCLKVRSEIARKQYDEALATLQSGMAMAKHVGEAPTLVQSLVGIAMAAMMLCTVDDLAQAPDSPNLYAALKALPRPLIDVEKPIATETKALDTSTEYTGAVREAMRKQVEPAYERIRQIARRMVADIGARQCVEALRHHVATHDGKLPAQLSDLAGVELPDDPVTQKPFKYHLDGAKAVLETTAPEGGSPREAMRYEITVAH
jgi:tetratricopeptide (TPR) repeat protein